MNRTLFPTLLAIFLAAPVRADNVEKELASLADDVVKVLTKQDQTALRIGKFTGGGDLPTHFGPEIQRILMQELSRRKIAINVRALIEITGNYRPSDEDPAAPRLKETFLRINVQMVNTKTGLPLDNVTVRARAVYGNTELARALGIPSSLPPEGGRKERNNDLRHRIDKPDSQTADGRISSSRGSPFSVEVLVVDRANAPDPRNGRKADKKDGLAFVPIKRGEFYRLRLTNKAPFEAAVKVSIDGLDQLVFSNPSMVLDNKKVLPLRGKDGKPRYNYLIVPKGKSIVVAGWFRDLKNFDYFVVTNYAKSAAAELKAPDDGVGQIVVQFHAIWEKDADRPADEQGARDANRDATGRVPGGKQNLIEVRRQVGVLRDTVAVRYTSK